MSRYNIIVAGCGNMANVWADYALTRSDATIVGLVDINKESAERFAKSKQLNCPIFTNIEDAITTTNANLVFDITVPSSHYDIASTAMRLGCDVLSEKPLAETLEQCLQLIELSQHTQRTHAIMQNRRFDPKIRALRNMIDDKQIGTVGFASADFFIGAHFGGFRDAMESPLLLDMAIHTFDQARFMLRANPISVYCHEFNPVGSWYKGNAMAICIFEMSDGSVFEYRGSWCAEGASTSWESSWRVIGDKGTIIWNGHDQPYAEVVSSSDQTGKFIYEHEHVPSLPYDMPLTFHSGCLSHMFDCLDKGIAPETSNSDNIYSMVMVLAALESARLGVKVNIPQYIEDIKAGINH